MIRMLNYPMRVIQKSLNRPVNLVNTPMNCLVRLKGPAIRSKLAAPLPTDPWKTSEKSFGREDSQGSSRGDSLGGSTRRSTRSSQV